MQVSKFKSVKSPEGDKGDLEGVPICLPLSRDASSSTKAPPDCANTYGPLSIHWPSERNT